MSLMIGELLNQKTKDLSFDQQIEWLVQIFEWLQKDPQISHYTNSEIVSSSARLKYIFFQFDSNPLNRRNFILTMTSVLIEVISFSKIANVKSISESGLLSHFFSILHEKFLPRMPISSDLFVFLEALFNFEKSNNFINHIDEKFINQFIIFFNDQDFSDNEKMKIHNLKSRLNENLHSSCYVVALKLLDLSITMDNELSDLNNSPNHKPEYQLLRSIDLLNESHLTNEIMNNHLTDINHLIKEIENDLELKFAILKNKAIQTGLIYLTQLQRKKIKRLKLLLEFYQSKKNLGIAFKTLIYEILLENEQQKSIRLFFKDNFSLLLNKILQANSVVGEHYQSITFKDVKNVLVSSFGGGAITTLTVYIKFILTKIDLSGFLKGFFDSLNYSTSFLIIQLLGFTLATKQPSATAPFLAKAFLNSSKDAESTMIAILRTQIMAVIGNLSFVFPLSLIVSWGLIKLGTPLFSIEQATVVMESTNLAGPSFLFAFYTAILLFASSLIAGWFENWSELQQLSLRISQNLKIRKMLGLRLTLKLSEIISQKSNALASNISLGILLGISPQILKFFNIPMEVRHVTLSMGAFASTLPLIWSHQLNYWALANSLLGIIFIGLINLSVSFILALLVASIASKIEFKQVLYIVFQSLKKLVFKPWLLIFPKSTTSVLSE